MALNFIGLYYFDDSGAGWLDPDSVWTNEADAFDGGTALDANSSASGNSASNFLHGRGTTAPATGDDAVIINVRPRLHTNGGASMGGKIYTAGLGEDLGNINSSSSGWGNYVVLPTPIGGWTWAKLNALEFKCYGSGAGGTLSRVEFLVETNRTLNNFWGAETGGLEETFGVYGSPTTTSSTPKTGGYSYRHSAAADHLQFNSYESIADAGGSHILGFSVRFSDTTPAVLSEFLSTATFGLYLDTNGDLDVHDDNDTSHFTITAPFTDATWHEVEIYWTNSPSSGVLEVFVDGVSVGSTSTIDTSLTHTFLHIYGTGTGTTDIDDIYIMSGAASSADRLGGAEVFAYRSSLNSATPDTDAGAGSAADALTAGTWLGVQTVPFDTSIGGEYTASGGGAGSAITNDVGGSSGGGPSTDTNITGDIVAAKGIITMGRSGGGATDHYLLLGNNTDGTTRGVDLDPTTSPVTYFTVSELATIVPTSAEYLQLGFEAVGNQDFSTYDMLATILHVPAVAGGAGIVYSPYRAFQHLLMR